MSSAGETAADATAADGAAGSRRGWARLSRRELVLLLGGSASAGAVGMGIGVWGGAKIERRRRFVPPSPETFRPSAYLSISTEGLVTVWVSRSEMGQG
ncbi:MAG: hypothetical protein AAF447_15510, partial [Myxococcota bacterium]